MIFESQSVERKELAIMRILSKFPEPIGARCFSLPEITRQELMSLTEECAKVTGIPYLMDCYRDEAIKILNS